MKGKFINGIDADSNIDPWRKLANAIIIQACRDYLEKKMSAAQLKRFCYGEWFQFLTDIDGDYLFERLVRVNDRERAKSGN